MSILSLIAAGSAGGSAGGNYPYSFPTSAPYNVPIYCPTPTYFTDQPWSGQGLHPSVVVFDAPWNGFRYWMAFTPFPTAPTQRPPGADWHENPSILASHDGYRWEVPAGLTNPLDVPPNTSITQPTTTWINTDTDLAYDPDTDELLCYWRGGQLYNHLYGEQYSLRTSGDGITWTPKQLVFQSGVTDEGATHVSPCFNRKPDGSWMMHTFVMGTNQGRQDKAWTAPERIGPWTEVAPLAYTGVAISPRYHVGVRLHEGLWYGVFQSLGLLYPGVSTDGVAWVIGAALTASRTQYPRAWDATSYRAQLWPGGDFMHVWYSTFAQDRYGSRIGYTRVPRSVWTNLIA